MREGKETEKAEEAKSKNIDCVFKKVPVVSTKDASTCSLQTALT